MYQVILSFQMRFFMQMAMALLHLILLSIAIYLRPDTNYLAVNSSKDIVSTLLSLLLMKWTRWFAVEVSQIPQCIRQISHNAPFCKRNVHKCAHFCYKMVHCGIHGTVGFVQQVYSRVPWWCQWSWLVFLLSDFYNWYAIQNNDSIPLGLFQVRFCAEIAVVAYSSYSLFTQLIEIRSQGIMGTFKNQVSFNWIYYTFTYYFDKDLGRQHHETILSS